MPKAYRRSPSSTCSSKHALVVFFSLGASVLHDVEAEAMIAEVMKDGAASTLSAVIFCDFHQPHKMWLWCNPAAAHELTPIAVEPLYELFPLQEFKKTGLIRGGTEARR